MGRAKAKPKFVGGFRVAKMRGPYEKQMPYVVVSRDGLELHPASKLLVHLWRKAYGAPLVWIDPAGVKTKEK